MKVQSRHFMQVVGSAAVAAVVLLLILHGVDNWLVRRAVAIHFGVITATVLIGVSAVVAGGKLVSAGSTGEPEAGDEHFLVTYLHRYGSKKLLSLAGTLLGTAVVFGAIGLAPIAGALLVLGLMFIGLLYSMYQTILNVTAKTDLLDKVVLGTLLLVAGLGVLSYAAVQIGIAAASRFA